MRDRRKRSVRFCCAGFFKEFGRDNTGNCDLMLLLSVLSVHLKCLSPTLSCS